MQMYPFSKKPAFFPFVSAEVFFEANCIETVDTETVDAGGGKVDNEALDRELDKILGLVEVVD